MWRRNKNFYKYLDINLTIANIKLRPNASHGCWMAFLLPVCLSTSVFKYATTEIFKLTFINSIGLSLASILFVAFTAMSNINVFRTNGIIVPGLLSAALSMLFIDRGIVFSLVSGLTVCAAFKYGLKLLLFNCPLSFTIGEGILIVQSIVLFIFSTCLNIYQVFYESPVADHDIITTILQLGMLSVFLVVITLFSLRFRMTLNIFFSTVSFYITLMLFVLHILLERSPVLWMILYIFDDWERVKMICYWALVSSLAAMAVAFQMYSGSKASTSRRKIFHLLSAVVYIPGLIYECNLIYLASGIALAAIIALETVRKLNIGWFSNTLNEGFKVFSDEKDIGGISITPMYLLVGIAGPIFLHPTPCEKSYQTLLALLSGILSVGIGDTAASYIGSQFGRMKWPRSQKSIEGTIANITSQLFTLYILSAYDFIELKTYTSFICVMAVVLNSAVEAITDQVDNITLPLITFCILNLA